MAKNKRILVMRVKDVPKGFNGLTGSGVVVEVSSDGGREWVLSKFWADHVVELENGAGKVLKQVLELCQQGYQLLPYDLPHFLREYPY